MNPAQREWTQNQMNKIHNYLVKMGASSEDAKDIVQDTFYKAFLYSDSINTEKLSAWLFRVAINAYYDLCRRSTRLASLPSPEELVSKEGLPEELLAVKEESEEVQKVLQELSPLHKQVLELRYKHEMSYKEIGESMDLKPSNVKTYLSRAKKQFAKIYRRSGKHE
ncbi:RNA polymerase sigma factor [Paenibacillus sp. J22TS3]|uniref:RNA polymerase sigma factor n=1 Tax=Paenibacillus sp. J22TS3 TaxID=2807192 RepID=UPI001B19CAFD|nr:RNA polymerase sigma factor [Paenibacillus sp. J22TS3]GIP21904.1 DNA-directed RNA polymerase sigma-70 factor [Paenibacillus sp. J22TS3]